jgi:hypothetical protein
VIALPRIALHAARVQLPGGFVAEAPVPQELGRLWAELGGDAEAWNTALSWSFAEGSSSSSQA